MLQVSPTLSALAAPSPLASHFPSDCRTVPELVAAVAAAFPERPALVDGDRSLGFGELWQRAGDLARGLLLQGLAPGDRVCVLVPPSLDLYMCLLGVLRAGAVCVFVEPAASPREIARVLDLTEPRALLGVPRAHLVRPLSNHKIFLPVWVAGRALGKPGRILEDLQALGRTAEVDLPPLRPDQPALLTFSSGTTGVPKGAVRTHGFLFRQHREIERLAQRPYGEPGADLTCFPIVVLSSLASGATAILARVGQPASETLAQVAAHRPGVIAGPPAFLDPLVQLCRRRGVALSGVRRMLAGGAPVSTRLCEAADETVLPDGRMTVVYGSTEAEPISAIDAEEIRRETGALTAAGGGLCVGAVTSGLDVALLPLDALLTDGDSLARFCARTPGATGEIAVRGAIVNERYYRNPEAESRCKLRDDAGRIWHRTGDVGRWDASGRLWFLGRRGDVVFRDGVPLYPAAVEAVAQAHPLVHRAALVADPDGRLWLVVTLARRRDLVRWSLSRVFRRRVRGALAGALAAAGAAVDGVTVWPRLPMDMRHRSKIDLARVRRRLSRRAALLGRVA